MPQKNKPSNVKASDAKLKKSRSETVAELSDADLEKVSAGLAVTGGKGGIGSVCVSAS